LAPRAPHGSSHSITRAHRFGTQGCGPA
jgi:hypothetical protein